ncbi:plant cysteine oxidase 4-like [Phoenix dactylifera]|uniref:cysteine dioxygenase n=1 Tax=Phoenix dactylifera TaxID=42345 RepID=A0A8B7C3F5_PHODC|nr:plant cysteine oxidase 4-like [Phoenix dactylifera]
MSINPYIVMDSDRVDKLMVAFIQDKAPTMAIHAKERSKVQRLYDACSTIFSSEKKRSPNLKQIRWLQGILDNIEPVDVGIDGSSDGRSGVDESSTVNRDGLILGQSLTQITYVHIHECDDFSMGVFCFPAGAKLPLHDHPEMVVLSKLLYGSASVKSYDWFVTPSSRREKGGLAKVVANDQVLQAPCKASVLFPRSGGNIHSFTALTPCAILDVLAPPYADEQGRPSTYYSETPIPSLPGYSLLEKRDLPEDLVVVGAPYLGPELIVDADF